MRQLDLVSHSRADRKRPFRLRGLLPSVLVHAVLVALAVGFHLHPLPIDSMGQFAGAPVISLETIVIIAPLAPNAPASPAVRTVPVIANVPSPSEPALIPHFDPQPLPPDPGPLVATHPVIGIPILPGKPYEPVQAKASKTGSPIHHQTLIASSGGVAHLRPASDKFVSTSGPGFSILPHPPYPASARQLLQSGIVRMLVTFDRIGNVAQAEVSTSSGIALLDSETRAFIRVNWHSTAYAGRAISVPVKYALASL